MICQFCKKENKDDAQFCAFCGKKIGISSNKSDDILGIISLIIAVVVIIIGIVFTVFNSVQTTVNESNPEFKPELELINSNFCKNELGVKSICGTVKNNGMRSLNTVTVKINFYDSENNLVGDTVAVSGVLHGNGQWKFKSPVTIPNVERYEIVKID
jgi:hypothetical protein